MGKEQSRASKAKGCNASHEWCSKQERFVAHAIRETAHNWSQREFADIKCFKHKGNDGRRCEVLPQVETE